MSNLSQPLSQTELTNPLLTVAAFCKEQGFSTLVPEVRTNANGYPYVTFITPDNNAENVYFSKEGSKSVAKGQPITKGFFKDRRVSLTENANGEQRWKISKPYEAQRVSIEDLI